MTEPHDGPPPMDESDQPTKLDRMLDALVDAAGLDAIKAPEPLIGDILQRNSTGWLTGPPGHGKSFVALDWAGCVGTGEIWQGHRVARGLVLYMVAEGLAGVRQRVRAWESSMGTLMSGVQFLPMAIQAEGGDWATLLELAIRLEPILIVIDTQARVTVGLEENSAKDMGMFVQRIEALRVVTGACVLVVHHQGRSGEHMRGSTALEGAATTIVKVKKDADMITVECQKQKDASEFGKIDLRLVPHENSAILALTDPSSEAGIGSLRESAWLATWWERHESEPVSVSVLRNSEVVSEATFHRHKFALIRAGLITKEGNGNQTRYRLTGKP
jgi:hypothetical protein